MYIDTSPHHEISLIKDDLLRLKRRDFLRISALGGCMAAISPVNGLPIEKELPFPAD